MILEIENVTKRFGGLVAVNRVSLGVEEGEILGLIGPNGAGKTTLLNTIAGVYKPDEGIIRFKGEQIGGLNPESLCKKGISRTFQISQSFPKMTVLENVRVATVFGNRAPVRDPQAWVEQVLDFVEFPVSADTPAMNLNTGQLKRLDLARALASNPELLLLDEAGAGLIPSELEGLMELARKIRDRGITIIVVEHIMRAIRGISDRVMVLHYGEKIAEGAYSEISKNERVVEAYLGKKHSLLESAHSRRSGEVGIA